MSDKNSNGGLGGYIENLRQEYGKCLSIIIILVSIFTAVVAVNQFVQILPFTLPKNIAIALLIILLVCFLVFRPLRKYEYIRYRYVREKGFLMLGPLRDVALRVRTLLSILETISQSTPHYEPILRQTGKKAGKDFAKDFQTVLNSERILRKKNLSFHDKFRRWLQYDSRAGMGKFQGNLNNTTFQGKITVQNSFVTHERQPSSDEKLCSFMTGYIEGALSGISGSRTISVSHSTDEGECGFLTKDPECCVCIVKNTRFPSQ